MAFGKPSIVVNRGGPRESVIEGQNGFLVEPDAAAFANAMSTLAGDVERCRTMGQAGHHHVQRFSWLEFSRHIDDALESLSPECVKSEALISKMKVDLG